MNKKTTILIIASMIVLFILGGFLGGKWATNRFAEKTMIEMKNQRIESWKETNKTIEKGGIVFIGDSLTEGFHVDEYFQRVPAINRGISGDTTEGVLGRMKESVYDLQPSKVFILIGTNDLGIEKRKPAYIVSNIGEIIDKIKKNSPQTEIFVQSLYPVHAEEAAKIEKTKVADRRNAEILQINRRIQKLAEEKKATYINVYPHLLDEDKQLKLGYTIDGLHLNGAGYRKVVEVLEPYVTNGS